MNKKGLRAETFLLTSLGVLPRPHTSQSEAKCWLLAHGSIKLEAELCYIISASLSLDIEIWASKIRGSLHQVFPHWNKITALLTMENWEEKNYENPHKLPSVNLIIKFCIRDCQSRIY